MSRTEFISYIKSIGFERDITRLSSFYLDVHYIIIMVDDYILFSHFKEYEYELNNTQPLIKIARKYKLKNLLK